MLSSIRLRFAAARQSAAGLYLLATLALLPLGTMAATNLLGGSDPMSPLEAFVPSVTQVSADKISLEFAIADGYYLYRDKTSFQVEEVSSLSPSGLASTASITLGAPEFSEAIVVSDDFFGEQATFRDTASMGLDYTTSEPLQSVRLSVKFQGCADIGLCYPPTSVELDVELPQQSTSGSNKESTLGSSKESSSLASPLINAKPVAGLFGDSPVQEELLPPDLAYLPQVMTANDRELIIRWQIEPGYYLYRDKLSFSLTDAGGAQVVSADIDPGVEQYDEFFGNVRILRDVAEARLILDPPAQLALSAKASLQLNYQGCADIGVCFPPSTATLPVSFDSTPSGMDEETLRAKLAASSDSSSSPVSTSPAKTAPKIAAPTPADELPQSEQDRLFSMLSANSLWLNVATFFGLGLLLAFTPCVLPMIPILSSLIVGQGGSMSTRRAFSLSLVYVLVMASTYAIVGVIVGLSGYNVQIFLQNPWVLSLIAVLFVALSLSMFGFFELQMPASIQAKLTQWSNKQGGGQVTGVAAMGFISTLIVGPCVTAPLAGALIYIAKTGDAVIGGAALFALGLGMGAPLLLIGTSAGRLLPRTGNWMNATKHVFGILLLGMAVYMISRFLPVQITMALYGILAIMSGIYFGATDSTNRDSSGWQRFGKGSGIIIGIYGLALLLGALSGNNSYRTPLKSLGSVSSDQAGNSSQPHEGLKFVTVKGVDGLQQAVLQATQQGRPVMLDFYADWCISCKEMEAFTFTDQRVQDLLANAVLVQTDVTANDALDQALLKQFDLFGPPGIIFYDATGRELPAARVIGFMNAEKFGDHVQRVLGDTGI
ncbi:Thiol:disulfide interchange protein DsbD [Granulosicoccus antarcticus IMCC3135]|uniref:Thiol:disulfide interchange protein DsbD n=2 Tax=Granulosicoccus TaxID=437504 RepID=A0A2Z2NP12_9GAMM|nr:Thiol:disulfide interchange protein DsbD [Granulosicoccus antarcticus IMCC3135]